VKEVFVSTKDTIIQDKKYSARQFFFCFDRPGPGQGRAQLGWQGGFMGKIEIHAVIESHHPTKNDINTGLIVS
jgi:hypothetical protein